MHRLFCTCASGPLGWISRRNIGGESICVFFFILIDITNCPPQNYTNLHFHQYLWVLISLHLHQQSINLIQYLWQSYTWTFSLYFQFSYLLLWSLDSFYTLNSNLYFPFYILFLHGLISHLLDYWPFSKIYFWESYI